MKLKERWAKKKRHEAILFAYVNGRKKPVHVAGQSAAKAEGYLANVRALHAAIEAGEVPSIEYAREWLKLRQRASTRLLALA